MRGVAPDGRHGLRVFAVDADREALADCGIPQIADRRIVGVPRFVMLRPLQAIIIRRRLLQKVGHVRGRRPWVTVIADFRIHEESVEDAEALRERVMVGRDGSREVREGRVAIGSRQVTEHLIVGPVLLDDVDHVLERRIGRTARSARVPAIRVCHSARERIERRVRRGRHDHERAVQLTESVAARIHPGPGHPGLWPVGIRPRALPLPVDDPQGVAEHQDVRRIPLDGNSADETVGVMCRRHV